VHKSNFLGQTLLFCFRANTKHLRRDQRCHFTTSIDISYYYSRVSRLRPPVWIEHISMGRRVIYRENRQRPYFSLRDIYYTIRSVRISIYYYRRLSTFFFEKSWRKSNITVRVSEGEWAFVRSVVSVIKMYNDWSRGTAWRGQDHIIYFASLFPRVYHPNTDIQGDSSRMLTPIFSFNDAFIQILIIEIFKTYRYL